MRRCGLLLGSRCGRAAKPALTHATANATTSKLALPRKRFVYLTGQNDRHCQRNQACDLKRLRASSAYEKAEPVRYFTTSPEVIRLAVMI